jgi:hypothetical protein
MQTGRAGRNTGPNVGITLRAAGPRSRVAPEGSEVAGSSWTSPKLGADMYEHDRSHAALPTAGNLASAMLQAASLTLCGAPRQAEGTNRHRQGASKMLIRIRCSRCRQNFTAVRELLDHIAAHDLASNDAHDPPTRASIGPR